MLRFALVGAGSIGKKHASCIRSIEGASIEAVVDTDIEAARALAGGEAKAFATLDEALASADVLVMLVDHKEFKAVGGDSVSQQFIVDTKGVWR